MGVSHFFLLFLVMISNLPKVCTVCCFLICVFYISFFFVLHKRKGNRDGFGFVAVWSFLLLID